MWPCRTLPGTCDDVGRSCRSAPVGVLPVGVIAVIALLARLVPVLRGGGLTGVQAYDDGVYYSASDALLSGRMPYRDYLLLHPPGITVFLAPFAALGRVFGDPVGLAAGRVAFMLVGTACAVLAWAVARRRVAHGRAAWPGCSTPCGSRRRTPSGPPCSSRWSTSACSARSPCSRTVPAVGGWRSPVSCSGSPWR